MTRSSGILALGLLLAPVVRAQSPADTVAAVPGSELTVYLLTMGQGDAVWERFGHNAIGIRNARDHTDVVYNWGLFSFEQDGFLVRFLRGEMMYWMGGFDAVQTVAEYRRFNRTVEIQELNLSPAQRLAMQEFVHWNAREENRFYRYNYFLDNCSTRVRDALDSVLGGAIRRSTGETGTDQTYRDHALRLLAADPLMTVGVDIGLGRSTDRPLTRWEEMFIPMKVRDYLREVRVPDETGQLVPLVTAERVVFQAERSAEHDRRPALALPLLLLGVALSSLLVWLHQRSKAGSPGARAGETAAIVLWGLVVGLVGIVLVLLQTMTGHSFAYDNTNVFTVNPIWFLLVLLVPFARAPASRRAVSTLAAMTGVLTVLGVVALFIPGFNQESLEVALLVAPVSLTALWIIRQRLQPATEQAPA